MFIEKIIKESGKIRFMGRIEVKNKVEWIREEKIVIGNLNEVEKIENDIEIEEEKNKQEEIKVNEREKKRN